MKDRIRTYVWEFPVRLTHWINVLCIIALSITGFYIGMPFMHSVSADGYIMGWMRFIHFTVSYLFLMSLIVRLYWAFMGNRFAKWRVFLPISSKQGGDMWNAFKFYTFLTKKPPYAVGHTALAGPFYLLLFLLFAFEIVSGFALYGLGQRGLMWTLLGGWLASVMHIQTIRLFHHIAMYLILACSALHIYIAWSLDTAERNGLMGSIFGGYKFVTGKEWE